MTAPTLAHLQTIRDGLAAKLALPYTDVTPEVVILAALIVGEAIDANTDAIGRNTAELKELRVHLEHYGLDIHGSVVVSS